MIGEFLYGLTPKDRGAPMFQPWLYKRTLASAATTVAMTIPLPSSGVIARVSGLVISGQAGAAQTLTGMQVAFDAITGTFTAIPLTTGTLAIAAPNSSAARADLMDTYVDPRTTRIIGSGFFSAGAAANTVTFTAWGVLIPIGNIPTPIQLEV